MNILVTGGSGYIGGMVMTALKAAGHQPVNFDKKQGQELTDTAGLTAILKQKKISAVMHFAAVIEMGESMTDPAKYFNNNFLGTQSLLQAMTETSVNLIIFSSTAGVYGSPVKIPVKETDTLLQLNPYGQSKLMAEELIRFYGRIAGIKSICLRYFNAAGAALDGQQGENHQPESHLIPNVLKAILAGRQFKLFGADYATADGTCIRDYIHVLDLAQAHILALEGLIAGRKNEVFNVGTGRGYSNRQVITMAETITGKKLPLKICPRRLGDAAVLVADAAKIKRVLGFNPSYSDLKTIISTAWSWHKNQVTI